MARESIQTKAKRIVLQHGVLFVYPPPTATRAQAIVTGDNGRYFVQYDNGRYTCGCPALGQCSHKLALAHYLQDVLPAYNKGASNDGEGSDGRRDNPGAGFFGE